mmetsp:Transcript_49201/g.76809  ORF Transcript_49201/g.76809 Transcript_49201/m.76809 type:complete len:198 (+) Transcript_49201:477-1070(+)
MGCGDAGAIAAWAAHQHPSRFVGAWTSSPTLIQARESEEPDAHVARLVGPECSNRIRHVLGELEVAAKDPKTLQILKQLFNAENLQGGDLSLLFADALSLGAEHRGKELCEALSSSASTGDSNSAPWMSGRIVALANLSRSLWGKEYGSNCYFDSECLASEERSDDRLRHWQSCTQYSHFPVNLPPLSPLVNSRLRS